MIGSCQHFSYKCRRLFCNSSQPRDKLNVLRHVMRTEKVDAFIIPSSDPHMSEYIAECYNRKKFISGFTGSAGTALVTQTKAFMWTDGR